MLTRSGLHFRSLSMTKRLLLNSLSGALLLLVNLVVAFLMSPIILRELGNRGYGIWEMILSFCGYLGILELGVGPAIVRYVSRELANRNTEVLDRILASAFWGLVLVGGLALIFLSVAALRPDIVLSVPSGEMEGLSLLLIIVGFSLCVQFVGALFVAYLMGSQEHFQINALRFVLVPLQAIVVYYVLTRTDGFELNWLAGIGLLSNVSQYGIFATMVLRRPEVTLRREAFSWSTVRELYRFGANSLVLMVSGRIREQSLPLVIGHTLGPASVVFYAIPKRLVDYARGFVLAMGKPLMPYLSAIDARRASGERMAEWIPLSRAVSFLTVPGAMILFALGKPFLARWLGPSYAEGGQWVIVALAVSFLLTGLFGNSAPVLLASAQHGPPARKVLVISIAAVIVATPATKQMGVLGAAIVLALADLAGGWVFWQAASREIGIGLQEHLRTTVKPLLLPAVLMAAALGAGRMLYPAPEYFNLLRILAGSIALYMAGVWRLGLASTEREMMQAKLLSLFRR